MEGYGGKANTLLRFLKGIVTCLPKQGRGGVPFLPRNSKRDRDRFMDGRGALWRDLCRGDGGFRWRHYVKSKAVEWKGSI